MVVFSYTNDNVYQGHSVLETVFRVVGSNPSEVWRCFCISLPLALNLDFVHQSGHRKWHFTWVQRVQNSGALLVSGSLEQLLNSLYWLLGMYSLKYKILIYAYKTLKGTEPRFLDELIIQHHGIGSLMHGNIYIYIYIYTRMFVKHLHRYFYRLNRDLWKQYKNNNKNNNKHISISMAYK